MAMLSNRLGKMFLYFFGMTLLGMVFATFYSSVNKPETASAAGSCSVSVYQNGSNPLSIRAVMTVTITNGRAGTAGPRSGQGEYEPWIPYVTAADTNYYHTYPSGGSKTVYGRYHYTPSGSTVVTPIQCSRSFTLNSQPSGSITGSCSASGALDVYVDVYDPDGGTPGFSMHIDNVGDFGMDYGGSGWRGTWNPPRNGVTYSIFIHVVDPQTSGVYGPFYGTYNCPLPPAAPTCSLSVNPALVVPNGSSTLSWSSTNTTSFTVDQGVGALSPEGGGSRTVYPGASSKTYTGTASGPGGSVNCSTTLNVGAVGCSLNSILAIELGETYQPFVTLSWAGDAADISVAVTVVSNGVTSTFGPIAGRIPGGNFSFPVSTSPAITYNSAGNFPVTSTTSGTVNGVAYTINCNTSGLVVQVVNKPYFKVFNGGATVGAGFNSGTTTCTTPGAGQVAGFAESYFDPNSKQDYLRGSSSQYDLKALGSVRTFYSSGARPTAQPGFKALTFANDPNSETYGGSFGGTSCITDYYSTTKQASFSTVPGGVSNTTALDAIAGASNQIESLSDLTLSGGNLLAGDRLVIYVTGNVYITDNITLGTNYTTVSDIPFFALVVKGNIMIDPRVSQLDGLYIAQPNDAGTGGTIYTCATSATTIPAAAALFGTCGSKLTFNGSVVAKSIKLLRTFGTLRNGQANEAATTLPSNIAEVFNGMPELFLANPAFKIDESSTELYDSITSLPPLL